MKISNQIWSTDNCGCVIEEAFDYDVPQDDMLPVIVKIHTKCESHAHLADDAEHFKTIRMESKKRQRSIAAVATSHRYTLTTEEKHLMGIMARLFSGPDNTIPIQIPDTIFHHQKSVMAAIHPESREVILQTTGLTDDEVAAAHITAAAGQHEIEKELEAEFSTHAERKSTIDRHMEIIIKPSVPAITHQSAERPECQ